MSLFPSQMYKFLTKIETEGTFSDFRFLNELFIKGSFKNLESLKKPKR